MLYTKENIVSSVPWLTLDVHWIVRAGFKMRQSNRSSARNRQVTEPVVNGNKYLEVKTGFFRFLSVVNIILYSLSVGLEVNKLKVK